MSVSADLPRPPGPWKQPTIGAPSRVAYVMSRFPKLTETFVLYELLALRASGIDVDIHPLLRARNTAAHPEAASLLRKILELFRAPNRAAVMHPEALRLLDHVHVRPLLSGRTLVENAATALARPRRYFGALLTLIRANAGSANFLLGGLAIFPKTVCMALDMERSGVEHVHAHFANHPAAAAFVIHRLTGIPYSFTAHGADLQVDQHMLREKVAESAFTVTISEYNKRFIVEHCGPGSGDKVRVIRCGVDPETFGTARAAPRGDGFRVLCIGTLYPVKGHRFLLEACLELHRAGVAFECHLVGDGPDRAALERLARQLGLANQIVFCGSLPRDDVAREIASADVLTVPSVLTPEGRREGIPVACMEGLAGGIPVVASAISGIPELIEDGVNGLLVPPGDPGALAAALLRLHADPALKEHLARAGRRTASETCDVHRNAAKLLEAMREAHARRSSESSGDRSA
jgi:colanic acid/amylovoran biosynthesis glycosyltransferase